MAFNIEQQREGETQEPISAPAELTQQLKDLYGKLSTERIQRQLSTALEKFHHDRHSLGTNDFQPAFIETILVLTELHPQLSEINRAKIREDVMPYRRTRQER